MSYHKSKYIPTGRPVGRPKKPKPPKSLGMSTGLALPGESPWRGGNVTRGKDRKGYRGGRKSMYPEGTSVWHQGATLSDAHFAFALFLGGGVFSKGLQVALDHTRKAFNIAIPDTRLSANQAIETSRQSINRAVAETLGLPIPAIRRSGSNRLSLSSRAATRRAACSTAAKPPMDFDAEVTQSDLENLENLNLENLEEWER